MEDSEIKAEKIESLKSFIYESEKVLNWLYDNEDQAEDGEIDELDKEIENLYIELESLENKCHI
jgi:archaellum component FlaC